MRRTGGPIESDVRWGLISSVSFHLSTGLNYILLTLTWSGTYQIVDVTNIVKWITIFVTHRQHHNWVFDKCTRALFPFAWPLPTRAVSFSGVKRKRVCWTKVARLGQIANCHRWPPYFRKEWKNFRSVHHTRKRFGKTRDINLLNWVLSMVSLMIAREKTAWQPDRANLSEIGPWICLVEGIANFWCRIERIIAMGGSTISPPPIWLVTFFMLDTST